MNFAELIKDTGAYKTVSGDKRAGRLSHAYLVFSQDGFLKEYLKVLAKIIVCDKAEPCGQCRACRLIDAENYPDAVFYPKKEGAVLSEDVADLIEKSYLKPVEGDKKIFIIRGGETMSPSAQNKLLKTLEEPPVGVHILIGAANEFSVLPTVRSRAKILRIPAFPAEKLMAALSGECTDGERLKRAVSCGDGTAARALELYSDEGLKRAEELAEDMLFNMLSSRDVLKYSALIAAEGGELEEFLSVLETKLRDALLNKEGCKELCMLGGGKEYPGFNEASYIYALERINEARERKKYNGGGAMLTDWLLLAILEGKHKWQRY